MNRSTPGLPVHHQLPEFTQTHVHDAIYTSIYTSSILQLYFNLKRDSSLSTDSQRSLGNAEPFIDGEASLGF